MTKLFVFIFPIALFFGSLTGQYNDENWKEKYNKNGLVIHIRHNNATRIIEFKSTITINAPIETCAATLDDYNTHPDYIYRVETAKLLETKDKHAPCIYYELDFPFPLSDRDLVVQGKIISKPETGEIIYEVKSEPDRIPLTDRVRIRHADGHWVLKKLDANHTVITNYGTSTTKGLPVWLVNLLVYQIPKSTLLKFKKLVEPNE